SCKTPGVCPATRRRNGWRRSPPSWGSVSVSLRRGKTPEELAQRSEQDRIEDDEYAATHPWFRAMREKIRRAPPGSSEDLARDILDTFERPKTHEFGMLHSWLCAHAHRIDHVREVEEHPCPITWGEYQNFSAVDFCWNHRRDGRLEGEDRD